MLGEVEPFTVVAASAVEAGWGMINWGVGTVPNRIQVWYIYLYLLGCGFKDFAVSPLLGEDSHFSNGLKPSTSLSISGHD